MKKIKTKINNATRRVFLGSIMKTSNNYLLLTDREKTMIKWFLKFQIAMLFACLSWIIPYQATQSHLSEVKALKTKVLAQEVFIPEAKAQQEIQLFKVIDEFSATVYAYNSFESQTDGDPFTGAFGDITGKTDIVANNCYLPGTIVEILGKKYKVYDRMNSRYDCNVFDIYMGLDHEAAVNFGKKQVDVKILRFNK